MFLLYLFQRHGSTSQGTTTTAARILCKGRTLCIVEFLIVAILSAVLLYIGLTEVASKIITAGNKH